tara:strand:+ start:395 stop:622 length:228 start_codon:yes stop_codon:yes gene_type:complete
MEVSLVLLVNKENKKIRTYTEMIELDTFTIAYFERKDLSLEFQNYLPQANMYQVLNYEEFFDQAIDSVHLDGFDY